MAEEEAPKEAKFVYQETIEFETPYKKAKVVMRGYLSAEQLDEINGLLSKDATEGKDDKGEATVQFKMEAINAAARKVMESLLVSLDGDEADVYARTRQLPGPDYQYVVKQAVKIREASQVDPKDS